MSAFFQLLEKFTEEKKLYLSLLFFLEYYLWGIYFPKEAGIFRTSTGYNLRCFLSSNVTLYHDCKLHYVFIKLDSYSRKQNSLKPIFPFWDFLFSVWGRISGVEVTSQSSKNEISCRVDACGRQSTDLPKMSTS